MSLLRNGQAFPRLEVSAVGGGTISIPDDLAGSFGVVLIYRGSWCPYCNVQLAAFVDLAAKFEELNIKTVALSVDDEKTSAALIEKHGLNFPVGHSADADKVSAVTGAFTNDSSNHLEPTGFVLTPDGSVITAVYSTGAIGRLMPQDIAGIIEYIKSQS